MTPSQSDPSAGAASASRDVAPHEPALIAPSARGLVARCVLLGAVSLGILADLLLRNPPWGLGLLLWMAAFTTLVIALARRTTQNLSLESGVWLAVAALFAAGLSWRDAPMLLGFDVLAMLSALVLLAMSMAATPVPGLALARVRDLIRAAIGTGLEVATGTVSLLMRDAELHTSLRPSGHGRIKLIAKALVITTPIVVVFTLLLTHADPVFGSFFTFPDVRLDRALSHLAVFGFFAWLVAGWLRRSLLADPAPSGSLLPLSITSSSTYAVSSSPLPLTLGAADVAIGFGALTILFAAFVAVQIGWLFGGEVLVLRTTGLSYAEYARRGFFELMWVAGLMLPVLLGAHALIADSDTRTRRVYRRLCVPLVALLGAIMLSAGARMHLYIHYYGISADRLYASAVMIWLAIVFAWFALTVLRASPRKFAFGMVSSGFAVLFALNVLNPDALVTRANLTRDDTVRTAKTGTDLPYLASLGADAVPLLVTDLTARQFNPGQIAARERCTTATILLHRWLGETAQLDNHWTQWNLARTRAAQAVRVHEAELRQLACPALR